MPEQPLTDTEILSMRLRLDRATPGPWQVRRPNGKGASVWTMTPCKVAAVHAPDRYPFEEDDGRLANAQFIAHARGDVPRLLAERDALRACLALGLRVVTGLMTLDRAEAWFDERDRFIAQAQALVEQEGTRDG